MNFYKCLRCGKITQRESNKKWLPSYCDEKGVDVYIMRIKPPKPKSNFSIFNLSKIFVLSVIVFVCLFAFRLYCTSPKLIENQNKQEVNHENI